MKMIIAQNNLIGEISAKQNITGKLNNAIIRVYPELEDLIVTPSTEQQTFKSNKYGYNNVTVEEVKSEELNMTPSAETQTKEGLYNKVIVKGDSNLVPENIKQGTTIFGVQGNAKTTNAKITNGYYLFYNGVRADYVNEILALCDNLTNCENMFYGCTSFTELDLRNLDTSNVTNMSNMFRGCSALTKIDLSNFNTNNVKNMNYMFYDCRSLVNLDISNFNTSNVTNMSYMFVGCVKLTNLDLRNLDTSNVTNMSYMFYNCTSLIDLDLSSFSMNKIINIGNNIFESCPNLTNFKSFKNLGKGYTMKSNNYSYYTLNLSANKLLTHESLMSVINNLYDLNLSYNVAGGGKLYTQVLNLGATNLAKLTAEEIAIATNKGWNVV